MMRRCCRHGTGTQSGPERNAVTAGIPVHALRERKRHWQNQSSRSLSPSLCAAAAVTQSGPCPGRHHDLQVASRCRVCRERKRQQQSRSFESSHRSAAGSSHQPRSLTAGPRAAAASADESGYRTSRVARHALDVFKFTGKLGSSRLPILCCSRVIEAIV